MIKNKLSKQVIVERLNEIDKKIPNGNPYVIFVERMENQKWKITQQFQTYKGNIKSKVFNISDLNSYLKLHESKDIPILIIGEVNDQNLSIIWHMLLKVANEEEIEILVNYMIVNIESSKKDIEFTQYMINLTEKYKTKLLKVDNTKIDYDMLSKKQLKKIIKILKEKDGE